MRILCAPDSFKESISAADAAAALARGAERAGGGARAEACPVADGGEGTIDALVGAAGGRIVRAEVHGPLGAPLTARYGVSPDGRRAFVELAEASGLRLVRPGRRDPTLTSTFGTGELIAAAARSAREIVTGLGGSATCDGGTGLAQALGGRFFDREGRLLDAPLRGADLERIARYEPPAALPVIRAACDVTSPLLGRMGAAAVFAPQKGASEAQVRALERGLAHLATTLGGDPEAPGAGAAGGAGWGLARFCGATLHRGIDLVLEAVGFEERCRGAALVLTGEGRLDGQSLLGKACIGVAAAAARLGVPTIAVVGATGPGAERALDPAAGGFLRGIVSLSALYGEARARRETAALLEEAAAEIVRRS